jgi:hypothetical protein
VVATTVGGGPPATDGPPVYEQTGLIAIRIFADRPLVRLGFRPVLPAAAAGRSRHRRPLSRRGSPGPQRMPASPACTSNISGPLLLQLRPDGGRRRRGAARRVRATRRLCSLLLGMGTRRTWYALRLRYELYGSIVAGNRLQRQVVSYPLKFRLVTSKRILLFRNIK